MTANDDDLEKKKLPVDQPVSKLRYLRMDLQ